MKEFACRKCGSAMLFIKDNGTQIGLYCSDCGAWQKWLGKDEQRLAEQWIEHMNGTNKIEPLTNEELLKALKYAHRFASRDNTYDFDYVNDIISRNK